MLAEDAERLASSAKSLAGRESPPIRLNTIVIRERSANCMVDPEVKTIVQLQ
jgi:hypothetical protein